MQVGLTENSFPEFLTSNEIKEINLECEKSKRLASQVFEKLAQLKDADSQTLVEAAKSDGFLGWVILHSSSLHPKLGGYDKEEEMNFRPRLRPSLSEEGILYYRYISGSYLFSVANSSTQTARYTLTNEKLKERLSENQLQLLQKR